MTDLSATAVDLISKIGAVQTILDVVSRVTGMGFAAVARVTEDRWIACAVLDRIDFNLKPGDELKVETTICNEIRQHRQAVVFNDAADSALFATHHTPALYGLQAYISAPIVLSDGSFFGTLCAIDPKPHTIDTREIVEMFRLFAELIAFHIDAQQRVDQERQASELREQFIAVLGHDLRNPLASIDAGTRMLQRAELDDKAMTVVNLMRSSVARMSGLIDNVLDFARGRLGGGLAIERAARVPLRPVLEQIVAELRIAHPERQIETEFADCLVRCDEGRIGQLVSNLVGNALSHGSADGPVRLTTVEAGDRFEISVSNTGEPIPPAFIADLFKPFARAAGGRGREGLGLGLYIAAEIAKAHGGRIAVVSDEAETRFTFSMPMR